MYNSLNLTNQISKTVTVLSSALDGLTKTIRNVFIEQMPIEFSDKIKKTIHGLDVLQNFNTIQDLNLSAFVKFSKELAESFNEEAFQEIISIKSYKKATISFFHDILNFYNVKNGLDKHLSSLSEYKHPKMEDLYEITRIQH